MSRSKKVIYNGQKGSHTTAASLSVGVVMVAVAVAVAVSVIVIVILIVTVAVAVTVAVTRAAVMCAECCYRLKKHEEQNREKDSRVEQQPHCSKSKTSSPGT